jgi:response regulator RpfG family c-di-GMP phosphodiesterase
MCATRIGEAMGLDAGSVEDIRTAALLFNLKELGVSNEVLCKAAQVSAEDLTRGRMKQKPHADARAMGNALRRAIPIFMTERQLRQEGGKIDEAALEVQVLSLAEEYENLASGLSGSKMAPAQAGQEVMRRASGRYDSMILDAFAKAFGGEAAGAHA